MILLSFRTERLLGLKVQQAWLLSFCKIFTNGYIETKSINALQQCSTTTIRSPLLNKKVDIFAQHSTLPDYLQGSQRVIDPIYISILREPISQAVSLFYWKNQETQMLAIAPEARLYRFENPGNFSKEHVDAIKVFLTQDSKVSSSSSRRSNNSYSSTNSLKA